MFEGAAGNRLVADTRGNPNWPPVLFLHGGGQTRHSWGGAAYNLAQHGWYTLSLDQRGHGDSDWTREDGYRTDTYKADLNAVLRDLNEPPALVGASLGGITSLVTVGEATLPERTARALVLVDVTPRLETVGVDSIEAAGDAVAAYRRHRSRPKDLSGLRKNLRLRDDGRYYWHWDPQMLTMAHESGYTTEERLRAAARRVNIPTLLVRGGSSDVVSEQGVKQFLEDVPDAKYVDVSGAGHMVAGDRNDVFTESVMDFLEATFQSGGTR
jgi:non-heme chloroperoxidase